MVVPYMDTTTTMESQITTSMVSEGTSAATTLRAAPPKDNYSHEFASIREFLARPYEYLSASWAAGATGVLTSFSVASCLLGNEAWLNKIAGYNLVRGTFCVKVQINANPFQQGRLLLHYIPCYSSSKTLISLNLHLLQKTLHPNVELDCRETEATLRIPYITPVDYYDFAATTPYDWGEVFLDVLATQRNGANASSTNVQYSIWTWFEDFEVAAPIPVIAYSDSSKEAKNMSNHPISSALKAVGSAAGALKGIPAVSSVAGSVEWASNLASGIAATAGYSKPDINDNITLVYNQGNRYTAVGDGPDMSIPLGLTCLNETRIDPFLTGRSEDETSFNFLKKRKCLFYSNVWGTGTTGNLNSFTISPSLFAVPYTITGVGHNITTDIYHPSSHLAQYFRYYRGGYKLTLKLIKTMFHSGRLEVIFTPASVSSGTGGVWPVRNLGSMRTIVDIRTTTEITFDCPYLLSAPYISHDTIIGTLYINILNPLKAPESVSTNVDMLWFVEAMDDFELAVPFPTNFAPPVAVVPYMDSMPEQTNAQNIQAPTTIESERSVGERFTNIKQLMKRFCTGVPVAQPTAPVSIMPHYFEAVSMNGSGSLTYPNYDFGFNSRLISMFAFYKGSMRVGQGIRGSTNGTSSAINQPVTSVNLWPAQLTTSYGAAQTLWSNSTWGNPTTLENRSMLPSVELEGTTVYARCPYYVTTKFTVVNLQFVDTLIVNQDSPNTFVNMDAYDTTPDSATIYSLYKAIGDDFQMGFFVATPPIIQSYS